MVFYFVCETEPQFKVLRFSSNKLPGGAACFIIRSYFPAALLKAIEKLPHVDAVGQGVVDRQADGQQGPLPLGEKPAEGDADVAVGRVGHGQAEGGKAG